jgi:hypothetical protein
MPAPYDSCSNFAVSAHYGMMAWVQGTPHRITIDEAAIPPAADSAAK